MRVLVTGHRGYIGAVLTQVLLAAGHKVVGWDTTYFEGCEFTPHRMVVDEIRKDVRDLKPQDLEKFDAVIHLAALSNDPLGELSQDWTHAINYRASVRMAESAKEAGVERFLFSSSCSMYGASNEGEFVTEEAPLRPLSAYAVSKVRVEEEIAQLANDHFTPVYLRNATVYGASPMLRVDLVLNNLVGWAYTTGKVLIMSDGTPWRPLIHVEDLSQVFKAMLDAPRRSIHNQAFNVGVNEENYQVRMLAEFVETVVPDCQISYGEQKNPDPRSYRVDFGKLARLLPEMKFRWNAQKGAEELYLAYRANHLSAEDFQGRKYIRLKQLKYLLDTGRLDTELRWS
jgi:nucleoside-diphosphate-sugar epimerase